MTESKENLLGFDISTREQEELIDVAIKDISENKNVHIVTINPEIIELALKNEELSEVIKSAEIVIPDGIGIKIGMKIKGVDIKRIAGIEFAYKLLEKAQEKGLPVALIGSKNDVLELASLSLKKRMPNLNIIYQRDGYFGEDDEQTIIENVQALKPAVILVALGAPKQEFFIEKLKKCCNGTIFIGVGGSFDVWSGKTKRAPEIFQKTGLEWLYRTLTQPSRFKRLFPTLPLFLFRVIINGRKIS